jgi:RNA recognition motif-containing protein
VPARLTVDGIPEWFTDYDLKELFTPYGRVLTARIMQPRYIPSYRYGFVEMVTMAEAERAREALNRARIDDHLIFVFIVSDENGD